jgi:hypothetical protein
MLFRSLNIANQQLLVEELGKGCVKLPSRALNMTPENASPVQNVWKGHGWPFLTISTDCSTTERRVDSFGYMERQASESLLLRSL